MPVPAHIAADVNLVDTVSDSVGTFRLYFTGPVAEIDSIDDAQSTANGVKSTIEAPLCACLTPSISFNSVHVFVRGVASDWDALSTSAPAVGSLTAGLTEPEEVCAVLQRRTGVAGRANRGRIFVPFVPDAFLERDSRLTAAAITAYRALGNALLTSFTPTGMSGPFVPAHYNRENSLMKDVVEWRLWADVGSRKDRRTPRKQNVLTVLT